MTKWIVACGTLLGAVVYLLIQLGDSSPSGSASTGNETKDPAQRRTRTTRPALPGDGSGSTGVTDEPETSAGEDAPDTDTGTLSTAELSMRLDEVYPERYYRSVAARCNVDGLDPDASAQVQYQLKVLRGEVLATNVRVVDSSLGDPNVEACIVAAIEQARWRDADMPDMDEEHDFYYRVKTQKKYAAQNEDD